MNESLMEEKEIEKEKMPKTETCSQDRYLHRKTITLVLNRSPLLDNSVFETALIARSRSTSVEDPLAEANVNLINAR